MLNGKLEIGGDFLSGLFKAKSPPLIGVDISSVMGSGASLTTDHSTPL